MKARLCRRLSAALIVTLLLCLLCPQAMAANTGKFGKNRNLTWTYKGTTLTISGKGAMNDFDSDFWGSHRTPWQEAGGQNAKVLILEEGVTTIGTYAFDGFSQLTSVSLPDSLTEIREGGFTNCASLTQMTIPCGVKSLGRYLFSRCPKLKRVTLYGASTVFEPYSIGWYYKDVAEGENVFLDTDFLSRLTLAGPAKSTAQSYAKEYGIQFQRCQAPRLTKTALRGVKNVKGRKLRVSWKRNSTGKGYEVRYSTDKRFKKGVKTVRISGNSTTSVTLQRLKKGKVYYVCIRTVNGRKTSGWSAVKRVKVKQ